MDGDRQQDRIEWAKTRRNGKLPQILLAEAHERYWEEVESVSLKITKATRRKLENTTAEIETDQQRKVA